MTDKNSNSFLCISDDVERFICIRRIQICFKLGLTPARSFISCITVIKKWVIINQNDQNVYFNGSISNVNVLFLNNGPIDIIFEFINWNNVRFALILSQEIIFYRTVFFPNPNGQISNSNFKFQRSKILKKILHWILL